MKIISHRGYWIESEEKNSISAFKRSWELCFGIETDIRDSQGQLVISHDAPSGSEMLLTEFLSHIPNLKLPLALNIKADGLAKHISKLMHSTHLEDWFLFDMSIPDMREYIAMGLPVFTRLSEIETHPVLLEHTNGVWIDAFDSVWYDAKLIKKLLDDRKKVCIVSPELHKRDFSTCWSMFRTPFFITHQYLYLCTDYPQRAKDFFYE